VKKQFVGRLTFSNVIACIALFVALGGASYAALKLPKNSVGAKQLKKGAVTGAKIKNGTISGRKLARGAAGTVPLAAHAGNADTVGGLTPAQVAAASKLRCPAGTILAAGVCFDANQRPAATLINALTDCGDEGMALPSGGQLAAFLVGTKKVENDWAGSISSESTNPRGATLSWNTGFGLSVGTAAYTSTQPYRCVGVPTN
jgi:hypothetical protein